MKKMKEISPKKWGVCAIVSLVVMILGMALLTYIVDPYFHYHAPFPGMSYRLYEQRYINDGISRHFDYDTIIIGNSLSENFKTSEMDELFDCKSVKLPYSGAGYNELWECLDRALTYNQDVQRVLVIMDTNDIDKEKDYSRYSDYPEYLYDDNIWNDASYLWNKDTFYRGTFYNILMTVAGKEPTTFDDYSTKEEDTGADAVMQYVDEIPDEEDIDIREYDEERKQKIWDNINENIISVVEKYPDVEFNLIYAPSSIGKWCYYYSKGQIECRINGIEDTTKLLVKKGNVKLYSFLDDYELVCDLNNYKDTIHYTTQISSYIMEMVTEDNFRITANNFDEHIKSLREFYSSFDYRTWKASVEKQLDE